MSMLAKLFQKPTQSPQHNVPQGSVTLKDLDPRVAVHCGIPSTASILAFDPIQGLLAIGTLDGRIKVIGGDNIEGLVFSAKPLPFKYLEFLENQGFLVSVSNENEVQVWDLEHRCIVSNLQWESNITTFSVIYGTHYMYIGDEFGFLSILKYDADKGELLQMPYHIPANLISEATGMSLPDQQSVIGVLSQPCSLGNRVLIAYQNGLIVLWDITEDRAVLVRGNEDLQLKSDTVADFPKDDTLDHEQAEKEISTLCWVSSDGSILAVGYVDGDILLWNMSTAVSSKDQQGQKKSNFISLQLSSSDRRLPVIVLHCSENRLHTNCGGQLFVYGGDEIGSEEVLTILNIDWSSGIESLKCVGRVDLALNGSFADMILVPNAIATEGYGISSLFVLSNPGQLHFYDDSCLSALMSQPEKKHSVPAVQYPEVIPTVEPYMTVGKLTLSEIVSDAQRRVAHTATTPSSKWPLTGGVPSQPLTGGVPSQLSFAEGNIIKRIYIAGYQDGSVRIWDATFPVLSCIFVLGSEVEGIEVAGTNVSVSSLEFLSSTSSLAIGNEYGLVRLYRLTGNSDETSLHVVTETKCEVHKFHCDSGARCTAIFSIFNSPVCTMQYVNSGDRLAVTFECGRAAMLDVRSLSVLFLTDCLYNSNSPAISLATRTFPSTCGSVDHSGNKTSNESSKEVIFILTRNANVVVMDGTTGNKISSLSMHPTESELSAISIYILEINVLSEGSSENPSMISCQDPEAKSEPAQTNAHNHQHHSVEAESDAFAQATFLGQNSVDSIVLICCEDALHLYSLKSLIKGESESIYKVKLEKPCCWTAIFKKDGKTCGLILVYQTGLIEIRSLPDLELVGESSLMSILRWNFKTSMTKTISSSDTGQIVLVNGCEVAFISLFAFENDFSIPEALPCLHDKVLEAATDATIVFSQNQKKQGNPPGIIGGIIKSLKGGKAGNCGDDKNIVAHLERIFSRFPFSDSFTGILDDQEVGILDDQEVGISDDQEVVVLGIDDIEIDEPVIVTSSSHKSESKGKDKQTERGKLFEGGSTATEPRMRTAEEIRAKYRKEGDASSAAAHARDKLVERQEKLEKLSRHTAELQSGAENFADLASELVKTMEKRKWWHI